MTLSDMSTAAPLRSDATTTEIDVVSVGSNSGPALLRQELQREILDRIVGTYSASQVRATGSLTEVELQYRAHIMVMMARLFIGFRIPCWPPGKLVRKIVRFFAAPLFRPQIDFNEAVRDLVLDLRRQSDAQAAKLEDAEETIAGLQDRCDALACELEMLKAQVRIGGTGPAESAHGIEVPSRRADGPSGVAVIYSAASTAAVHRTERRPSPLTESST